MLDKNIIFCGENHTIRRTNHSDKLFGICTIGLMTCVAVVIRDSEKNVSLTHVDACTDMTFIKDELEQMGKNPIITIYRNTHQGRIPDSFKDIAQSASERYLDKHRLKYTVENINYDSLIISSDGTCKSVMSNTILALYLNKRAGCAEGSIELLQKNVYERQLTAAFSNGAQKPTLKFDGVKFLNHTEPKLARQIINYLCHENAADENAIKRFYHKCFGRDISFSSLMSAKHVIPRYKHLLGASLQPIPEKPTHTRIPQKVESPKYIYPSFLGKKSAIAVHKINLKQSEDVGEEVQREISRLMMIR